MNSAFVWNPVPVCAIVDGEPFRGTTLPDNVKFVGMEATPNERPRYGKVYHPWHNFPCYETLADSTQQEE